MGREVACPGLSIHNKTEYHNELLVIDSGQKLPRRNYFLKCSASFCYF